ncbi:hypothetical protein MBLNU459_g4869t1 [Dothideomycetes sp. NU459]
MAFNSPRASPFRRPESPLPASPSTVRASTPTASPTKFGSPTKPLSPSLLSDKGSNPFVRRPSQLLSTSERPSSPFTRPSSRLSVVDSPSRALSFSREPVQFSRNSLDRENSFPADAADPFVAHSPSPAAAVDPLDLLDGAVASPSAFNPPSPTRPLPMLSRPAAQRTVTSSTAGTVRPFSLQSATSNGNAVSKPQSLKVGFGAGAGNYNHVPQPLLRSMRESFEVLDSANSGMISSASVAEMLQQLGLDGSPRSLAEFFPPTAPANLNLARFLDTLSAPFSDMSHPDELAAAFGAFDVDDSGQIDLAELKDALLHTAPEPGADHARMTESEIDNIMADFSARRAFGGKGVLGKDLVNGAGGKGRGDVFRYRDFMATVTGGGLESASEQLGMA